MRELDKPQPGSSVTVDDAPLVDEVLAATPRPDWRGETLPLSPEEQLAALRADVVKLKDSIAEIASGASRMIVDDVRTAVRNADHKLAEHIVLAIAIAGAAGFIAGVTMRRR
ncbi:hypothetical protein PYH37_000953 [Sinorhizobium numidicum]|uniref:DUF3618 domain-containing protein n=1 Tax=Sinorhizobium numidicum TaxID=680248 RepID=A0ABY8CVQ0_9HYPH|nr:hypothetical protein [Sinorhizobium numidicum]WEX75530.1 hypothetical protein PYH37_000953 [Sinorhizobium numidicum]WEX81527.1 hypothetical protein PYH38_000954 [Sinorhizobium numidicum]